MVEANGGNDGNVGIGDVGRIEPTAKPHLEHLNVDGLATERLECHRRQHLERRRPAKAVFGHRLGMGPDRIHRRDERLGRDGLAVDADTLTKGVQVRRREEADALAMGAQDARRHCRDGALALGSGDLNNRRAALGIAEAPRQLRNPRQVGLDRRRTRTHQPLHIDEAEQAVERAVVGAGWS